MGLGDKYPYLEILSQEEKISIELAKIECDIDKLLIWTRGEVDWEKVVKIAIAHGIGTIVYENMRKFGLTVNIDPKVLLSLQIYYSKYKQVKRLYAEELNNLSREFSQMKLKIVGLKGVVLNAEIYLKNVRDYTDIDLLVSDKDLETFYIILSKNGYKAEYENKSLTKEEWVRLCAIKEGSVCEFTKRVRGLSITFDVHRFTNNNSECLNYVYDSAYRSEKLFGLYVPDNYHMLIYACFHAWKHYPYTYRIKSLNVLMTIKHLMDIREIYRSISDRMWMEKLLRREGAYDVVYEMLYLTNRIYGDLDVDEASPKIQHDYCSQQITSWFEERLFRPYKEKEKLDLIEKKDKRNSKYPCIPCTGVGDSTVEIYLYETWKDVYGSILLPNEKTTAKIRFVWNQEYFMVQGVVYEHHSELGRTAEYEENQVQAYLIFHSDWENRYMLQMKNGGQHVLFKLNKNFLKIKKIKDALIKGKIEEDCYTLDVKIPWKELLIIPHKGDEFEFTFSIEIGRKKEFFYQNLVISDYDTRVVLL